jgi:hypothetical protein
VFSQLLFIIAITNAEAVDNEVEEMEVEDMEVEEGQDIEDVVNDVDVVSEKQ